MNQPLVKILFLTKGGIEIPTNRLWFHNMAEYLKEFGFSTFLNDFSQATYDIIFINRLEKIDLLYKALKHSPEAHIGVFFGSSRIDQNVAANVDFYFSYSFMFHEMLLSTNRRIYDSHDYFDLKERKEHTKSNHLILGYHGNEIHFQKDFFPNGANALQRLAAKYDFEFHVVIKNAKKQPQIPGVKTIFYEWELETHEEIISKFDIGIVPALCSMKQLGEPFSYLRNPNRVNLLLSWGIPSVTSPIPEVLNQFSNNENILYAVSEDGWYDALEQLISKPKFREKISLAGYALFKEKFSTKIIVADFAKKLKEELEKPRFSKPWIVNNSIEKEFKKTKRKNLLLSLKAKPKEAVNLLKKKIKIKI